VDNSADRKLRKQPRRSPAAAATHSATRTQLRIQFRIGINIGDIIIEDGPRSSGKFPIDFWASCWNGIVFHLI
jgi:class 3 adenylate cyclase